MVSSRELGIEGRQSDDMADAVTQNATAYLLCASVPKAVVVIINSSSSSSGIGKSGFYEDGDQVDLVQILWDRRCFSGYPSFFVRSLFILG